MEESGRLWSGEPLLLENRSHHGLMSISVIICDQGSANTRVWSQPERTPSALCQLSNPFSNTLLAAAAKSLQSCPTLCDPVDYSPPGSSVPRILQARTPEWVAISFSKYTTGGFSQQARTWAQQKGARPALAPDIDGLPAGNSQVPTPAVAEQSTSGRAI